MSKYTVDSIEDSNRHLNDLLDVICQIRYEAGTAESDPRLDSILWLARDLSNGIVERINLEGQAAVEQLLRGRVA